VDLKRLDESPTANEVSFITSFQTKTQLLELREALFKLDNQLEVTFLDNTKIF
jgi:ribosomal protein L29